LFARALHRFLDRIGGAIIHEGSGDSFPEKRRTIGLVLAEPEGSVVCGIEEVKPKLAHPK